MNKNLKKIVALGLIVSSLGLTGCFRRDPGPAVETKKTIDLTYYKLFDDEDAIQPLIQAYQAKNANVRITYKKFTNPAEYEDLIVNELAEGGGPDIFSMPNYWFNRNYRKLAPAPDKIINPASFESNFVSVASNDLTFVDEKDNLKKVYGIPLGIDTLALFYNKSVFEDKIPSRGKPAEKAKKPFTLIVGGAKIDTKIGVLKNLLKKVDQILIGGALANTFLLAEGFDIGKSYAEKNKIEVAREILALAEKNKVKIYLPVDSIVASKADSKAKTLDLPLEDIEGDMSIFDTLNLITMRTG